MWWQGEDNCPEIVKLCWASLKKHCGARKIIIITKDNYQDYITLPEYIMPKVSAGHISFTHLSDIIRLNLLTKYGGLWIDSTIFVADEIPEDIFSMKYYTIKFVAEPDYNFPLISFLRWAVFFLYARDTNSFLFSFMRDMIHEYLKTHDELIDYLFMDYSIEIACEEFPQIQEGWEKLPVNNADCLELFKLLNEEWNAERYAKLRQTTRFFKTTYKRKYNTRTADGKETVYGHLLSEYGIIPAE